MRTTTALGLENLLPTHKDILEVVAINRNTVSPQLENTSGPDTQQDYIAVLEGKFATNSLGSASSNP